MNPPSSLRTISMRSPRGKASRHRPPLCHASQFTAPNWCGALGASRRGIMTAARDLFRAPKQVGNMRPAGSLSLQAIHPDRKRKQRMKDFSNASFSPELIKAMDEALEGAVATLPHPVSSTRVRNIAESILRSAKQGESNPRTLQTMALVEMQIRSGEQ